MATSGNIAVPQSGTDTLINLIGAFRGGSQTTKSNISKQGMDQIIQQILGGPNGLAGIASGAKNAGVYGSTTQQLLTNDLVTRTAGELAKQKAGTTTTTAPKLRPTDVLGLIALSGAKSLAGPTVAGLGKAFGVDQWGNKIAKALGVEDTLSSGVGSNVNAFAPSPDAEAIDLFSGTGITDSLASFGEDLGSNIASSIGSSVGADVGEDIGGDLLGSLFG